MYLDMIFRCGIPNEHFPLLQESLSEAIIQTQPDKACIANIGMSVILPDGKAHYTMIGQLVGINEVHIIPLEQEQDWTGNKRDVREKNK